MLSRFSLCHSLLYYSTGAALSIFLLGFEAGCAIMAKKDPEGATYETCKLECERPAGRAGKGLFGLCGAGEPGHSLPAGDQAAAGAGGV